MCAICRFCGDPIGFYEPIFVLNSEGRWRRTSLVNEPQLETDPTVELAHAVCAHLLDSDRPIDN